MVFVYFLNVEHVYCISIEHNRRMREIRQNLLKYKPISDEDKQDCHWLNCNVS